jgi:DNA-cytosine methyltransferase
MKYVDYNDDTFEMDGFVWFSFTKIEKSDIENVYNIEVETDHSYLVSGCVSANCQDFSRAGIQRGGEKGSGTRSSLLWECERTIREKRPAYCLLENVKALYSDKKFYPLLLRWKDTVNSYGYKSWIQVLNAKDYDVPQGRERVFMVSIREDILEKDFNGADYYFPAPMEPKREITDFLVSHDMIPEEYYLSEHKIPKFLNLINHAGDEFDEALDDEQKEAITAVDRALPGQERKKDIRQISLENGLGGYVPVKTKENALI